MIPKMTISSDTEKLVTVFMLIFLRNIEFQLYHDFLNLEGGYQKDFIFIKIQFVSFRLPFSSSHAQFGETLHLRQEYLLFVNK